MSRARRDIIVEVRRENDGQIYSRVLNRAIEARDDTTRVDGQQRYVVIDRAKGRGLDSETVINRAQYLAECLGVEYLEDLTWPCSAAKGGPRCQCPACAEKADARARVARK